MTAASLLVTLLRDPARATDVPDDAWGPILSVARAEALAGTLGHRVASVAAVPPSVARRLAEAADAADIAAAEALWEARMVAIAVRDATDRLVLLKGTAYAARGLAIAAGRQIGDCDILVPRADLGGVEAALEAAGWGTMKPDPYDQLYYRRWMHELPPLVHDERARMVDVHHSILPLTHAATPDAPALLAGALPVVLPGGVDAGDAGARPHTLAMADMVVHAAAHCLADGALDGGLRNLWDIAGLLADGVAADPGWWDGVAARAALHGLGPVVVRAQRLAHLLYGAPVDPRACRDRAELVPTLAERAILRRLLARDGWGRPTRPLTRALFEARGHLMRMPAHRLAIHAATKATRGWFSSAANNGKAPRP